MASLIARDDHGHRLLNGVGDKSRGAVLVDVEGQCDHASALIERALGAEMTEHLGYEKGDAIGRGGPTTASAVQDQLPSPQRLHLARRFADTGVEDVESIVHLRFGNN